MSFKRLGYTAFFGLSLLSQMGFAAQETMVFKNHHGSILELTIAENDSVTGYFTTQVATKDCPQVIGQKRPVVGFLTGNAMTLSIDYPSCGSVLSIVGNIEKDKQTIDTTWIVAHQVASTKNENNLVARFIGHNSYHRIANS